MLASDTRRARVCWSTGRGAAALPLLLVVVVVVAALVGCGATAATAPQRRTMRRSLSTDDDSDSPSIWKRVTFYDFGTANNTEATLSFCTTKRAAECTIFAVLPVESMATDALEMATRESNGMTSAFDSSVVARRDVVEKGTVHAYTAMSEEAKNATISGLKFQSILYRVKLPAAASSGVKRCVDTVLQVCGGGMYVLFASQAQANVTISIVDSLQREIEYSSCVSGCESDGPSDDDGASESANGATTASASASLSGPIDWAAPILASVAIALVSLLGVLLLSLGKKHVDVVVDFMMSFAAGCLLGVAVFHLYPEGSGYAADMGAWVGGACVLGGIAISMAFEQSLHLVLQSFNPKAPDAALGLGLHEKFPHKSDIGMLESLTLRTSRHVSVLMQSLPSSGMAPHRRRQNVPVLEVTDRDGGSERSSEVLTFRQKYVSSLRTVAPIAWVTAVGDFVHAFTDGVVLAVAFKICSSSVGWAVALGIILHEVPHRVGDYFIFLQAGMLVSQALVLSFVASLASLLGVITILSVGPVSATSLGIMLTGGAGALLFIALVKLLPPMLEVRHGGRAFVHFACFAVGCAAIGVAMLDHAHCEAAATGRAHAT